MMGANAAAVHARLVALKRLVDETSCMVDPIQLKVKADLLAAWLAEELEEELLCAEVIDHQATLIHCQRSLLDEALAQLGLAPVAKSAPKMPALRVVE